jgi:hypothetical protein
MEYKMFGLGGFPGDRFRKGLRTLFALNNKDWDVIERWFLTTESYDPDDALSSPAFVASSLTPDQANESIRVLQFILETWHMRRLELQAIQRDLMLLGRSQEEIDRLARLLERLGPARKRAWASYMRSGHQSAVLPTLEDVNIVCDLRPIFEDYVYPSPETETEAVRHDTLLDFTYVVLADLQTEDSMGRKQRLAFQMTEKTLTDLGAAIRRAQDQLAILKNRTRDLAKEDQ